MAQKNFKLTDGLGVQNVRRQRRWNAWLTGSLLSLTFAGCGKWGGEVALQKSADGDTSPINIPKVPVPAADGPRLGAVANVTPIFEAPNARSRRVGHLHAGATVARADKPYDTLECPGGWYPVRPRGFVCATESATLDLQHPTLLAMALKPQLDQTLPYTFARATQATEIYARNPQLENAVRSLGPLRDRSHLAVVGSWSATDPDGQMQRLAMTTDGHFVKAVHLAKVEPSSFHGFAIDKDNPLPAAFVVKRGIRAWKLEAGGVEKLDALDYHLRLPLTGRFRTVEDERFWAIDEKRWVRHRDVTILQRRENYPDFATPDQKWIDVSVVTGTLVLYEGKQPIYATLVSVGRDRLGDPKTTASTALGDFEIVKSHISLSEADPKKFDEYRDVYDVPWALELSSGQYLHGATWHDRFGIEHGPGNLQLAPEDAAFVWRWVDPQVPEGWHASSGDGKKTLVRVRK